MYAFLAEIAAAEKLSPSYVSRIARLAQLAPDIVEAILDGRQAVEMTVKDLMQPLPVAWEGQCDSLRQSARHSAC